MASLQQELRGSITDVRRREVEVRMLGMKGRIQKAKEEQKKYEKRINDEDKKLREVSLARDEGLCGCGCGVQCGSFGTASLFCTQSIVSLRLALFPGHTPTKKSGLVSTVCTCM